MNPWPTAQIGLAALALLLALLGDKLSIPILLYGGIALFGAAAILVGLEAMLTQRILFYRQQNYRETFRGLAAYAQGVQYSLIGIFLIGVAMVAYLDNGQDLVLYLTRRPWSALVVLGIYCLMQAVITGGSSFEQNGESSWAAKLEILVGGLLPGAILVLIGLGALGLGLFEFLAPAQFDALGGRFLEVLFRG